MMAWNEQVLPVGEGLRQRTTRSNILGTPSQQKQTESCDKRSDVNGTGRELRVDADSCSNLPRRCPSVGCNSKSDQCETHT